MAAYAYERLSAADSSFLALEGSHSHMHVGGPAILEAGPLATTGGGVDIERIRAYVASRLPLIPRYRQRLAYVPISNQPVWVDDDHFKIHYHVRHTRIPHPGDERQLKRLAAWIMSQRLDRAKPLWELWIVEGLQDDRFAMVTKTHHCMVDGVAGVELLSAIMKPTPDEATEEVDSWIPRPAPRPGDLLREEFIRGTRMPLDFARRLRNAVSNPRRTAAELEQSLWAMGKTIEAGLRGPARTPLNQSIGPHRRFDWLCLDLAEVKEVKNRLGGTVNDVVLATVAGAVGEFLRRRRVNVDLLDFRATIPVNVRLPDERAPGNRVSAWLTSLPIQERNPTQRVAKVRQIIGELKQTHQARGAEMLMQVGDWAGPAFVRLAARLAALLHPYNLIVSNVPGPQFPLYLLGARMLEGYPLVPLFEKQGLGVALFSYTGKLCWGFNADWDLVPDLHDFVQEVETSFRELYQAAVRAEVAEVHRFDTSQKRRRGGHRESPSTLSDLPAAAERTIRSTPPRQGRKGGMQKNKPSVRHERRARR